MAETATTSTTPHGVTLRLEDPAHHATTVRLWSETPLEHNEFSRVAAGWVLELKDLDVDRLEYLFEIDGRLGLDPGNPLRVPGAFGDHSWVPLAGYRAPTWLEQPRIPSELLPHAVSDTPVGRIELTVWSPAETAFDAPLPLVMAHDGPEMSSYGQLTDYAAAMIAADRLPPHRIALLSPGERNHRYSANDDYATTLVEHVVPLLAEVAPSPQRPAIAGQSLGGLAALHAAWRHPGTFSAVFAQSGSFFTPDLDPQESDFSHWDEIVAFTAQLHDPHVVMPPLPPIGLTCGTAEENLANNQRLFQRLHTSGRQVSWGQVRDGHTWTCWRDLLDPYLTDLLVRAWDPRSVAGSVAPPAP